jgi:hypothetical protein
VTPYIKDAGFDYRLLKVQVIGGSQRFATGVESNLCSLPNTMSYQGETSTLLQNDHLASTSSQPLPLSESVEQWSIWA